MTQRPSSYPEKIADVLHDFPIFLELSTSRIDLLLTTAVIALTLSNQEEALNLLPEFPESLDAALSSMSIPQMQLMLAWMALLIKEKAKKQAEEKEKETAEKF